MISGFTFIKNGLSLGYPFLESILSIEPLCSEVIVNVGFENPECTKDDGTHDFLRDNLTGSKYKFIKSWWDPKISSSGRILAQQTNIALAKCRGKSCQYIQGDEAIHENDLEVIEEGHKELSNRSDLYGLIFKYLHFYGNTNSIKYTRSVYRREIRAIKNDPRIISWRDAQGFRFENESKLTAKLIDATIYHYGWARPQDIMDKKIKSFNKLYHGKEYETKQDFSYEKIWGVKEFSGGQPRIMSEWVKNNTHAQNIHSLKYNFKLADLSLILSDFIEEKTGYRMGEYKNYIKIK